MGVPLFYYRLNYYCCKSIKINCLFIEKTFYIIIIRILHEFKKNKIQLEKLNKKMYNLKYYLLVLFG